LILFGKKNDAIDVVITPLLAFDLKGYRVGYGKGFYDRFFASLHNDAKRIGISLFGPCSDIENITELDIPLTHCVTPNKTYTF
jgi:5-formyltetrahydrofolate cyclo-ligase